MRKNFGAKPFLYPMPVLILGTYDADGTPNAMNAAWGGIADTEKISICLGGDHKTTENLLARREFTVSIADAEHTVEADYVGIVSGKKVPDKLAKAGLHTVRSEFVDAPVIEEFPMTLECRMVSYEKETGLLIGEIVNVSAEERILDENGKVDPSKLNPITFDPVNHVYLKLGEKAGNAFQDGLQLKK